MRHPTLDQTSAFIRTAHAGQVDKAGKPYHLHPEAVEARLGADASVEDRHIALLHDVIEDTAHTAADLLAMGYSAHIVASVALLSRPEGEGRPSYIDCIKEIAASGNASAVRVKVADLEDNLAPERVAQLPPEQRGIVRRYERSLKVLREV